MGGTARLLMPFGAMLNSAVIGTLSRSLLLLLWLLLLSLLLVLINWLVRAPKVGNRLTPILATVVACQSKAYSAAGGAATFYLRAVWTESPYLGTQTLIAGDHDIFLHFASISRSFFKHNGDFCIDDDFDPYKPFSRAAPTIKPSTPHQNPHATA